MTEAASAQRDLARWLMAVEMSALPAPAAVQDAAENVCQKLSRRLARVITLPGYSALLARALHLARAEFPILDGVRAGTTADQCLDGLSQWTENVEPSQMREALTAVLAGILGLLDTFIGRDLSVRLIRDVWPDAPFSAPGMPGREAEAR